MLRWWLPRTTCSPCAGKGFACQLDDSIPTQTITIAFPTAVDITTLGLGWVTPAQCQVKLFIDCDGVTQQGLVTATVNGAGTRIVVPNQVRGRETPSGHRCHVGCHVELPRTSSPRVGYVFWA